MPGFTGKPLFFSDGKPDYSFSECPSCLGFHAVSNISCNGKRMFTNGRCLNILAKSIQCDRPRWHLGEHLCKYDGCRIQWRQF